MSKFDRLEALKGTMSKAEVQEPKKKASKKKKEKAVEAKQEEVLEKVIVETGE